MRKQIDGYTFAQIDLLIALLIVFAALAVLALKVVQKSEGVKAQGTVIISLYWQKGLDDDVDLWVQAPGEPEPVGYMARDGKSCDLLRDDRGDTFDPNSRNMEMTVCRGSPAGEYIVNAVLYANEDRRLPVPVWMTVQDATGNVLLEEHGQLLALGDEITLARFRLDEHGALVRGSVNTLPKSLYEFGHGP